MSAKPAPGPHVLTFMDNWAHYRKDPVSLLGSLRDRWGDTVHFRMLHYDFHLVNHPDAIAHVLKENSKNYVKMSFYRRLKPLFGDGLVTSEGESWRQQRKLVQPAFHMKQLEKYFEIMKQHGQGFLGRWSKLSEQGKTVELCEEMMTITLQIFEKAFFNRDTTETSEIGSNLTTVLKILRRRVDGSHMNLPRMVPTPANNAFYGAIHRLNRIVYRMISERGRNPGKADDLLSTLVEARDDETSSQLTEKQLRDQVMTLVVAGHETSAMTLTWTLYLLSKEPAALVRAREELEKVLSANAEGKLSFDDLDLLPFTRACVFESLRLYPAVWQIGRSPIQDDEVMGYRLPARTSVFVSPYVVHRHPDFWENPEKFDPERFMPGRYEKLHPHAFIPFASGPRGCIGASFAMTEILALLSVILPEFDISLIPGQKVELEPLLTLRPKGGLHVKIKRRSRS